MLSVRNKEIKGARKLWQNTAEEKIEILGIGVGTAQIGPPKIISGDIPNQHPASCVMSVKEKILKEIVENNLICHGTKNG